METVMKKEANRAAIASLSNLANRNPYTRFLAWLTGINKGRSPFAPGKYFGRGMGPRGYQDFESKWNLARLARDERPEYKGLIAEHITRGYVQPARRIAGWGTAGAATVGVPAALATTYVTNRVGAQAAEDLVTTDDVIAKEDGEPTDITTPLTGVQRALLGGAAGGLGSLLYGTLSDQPSLRRDLIATLIGGAAGGAYHFLKQEPNKTAMLDKEAWAAGLSPRGPVLQPGRGAARVGASGTAGGVGASGAASGVTWGERLRAVLFGVKGAVKPLVKKPSGKMKTVLKNIKPGPIGTTLIAATAVDSMVDSANQWRDRELEKWEHQSVIDAQERMHDKELEQRSNEQESFENVNDANLASAEETRQATENLTTSQRAQRLGAGGALVGGIAGGAISNIAGRILDRESMKRDILGVLSGAAIGGYAGVLRGDPSLTPDWMRSVKDRFFPESEASDTDATV